MTEPVIELSHITKDYGGRGIFDINLAIEQGTVFGYAGTNGSGKTTTIRTMMGFIKAGSGTARVKGMDPWQNAAELKRYISYVPGEIEFPRFSTGEDFLRYYAKFLNMKDFSFMYKLIDLFALDPSAPLSRMSKGMKQKTALTAALMGDKEILLLDEPTTGLDPLMRDVFLSLIEEEKAKGKTIFMSSHIFEEIEEVCDRAAIIHQGSIVKTLSLEILRNPEQKHFHITFDVPEDGASFASAFSAKFGAADLQRNQDCYEISILRKDINLLLQLLKPYKVKTLREEHLNLETVFKRTIGKGGTVR